jgi:hypothetical protein
MSRGDGGGVVSEPIKAAAERLIAAGFTGEELESIAHALQFAVIVVAETSESQSLNIDVGWTEEKRRVWAEVLPTLIAEFPRE